MMVNRSAEWFALVLRADIREVATGVKAAILILTKTTGPLGPVFLLDPRSLQLYFRYRDTKSMTSFLKTAKRPYNAKRCRGLYLQSRGDWI